MEDSRVQDALQDLQERNGRFLSPEVADADCILYGDFTELDEAVKMFDPALGFLSAKEDMIFSGDLAKWTKFANSLRLRLALRVSEVDANLCKTQAQAAITAGVMASEEDDAKCPPSNEGWGNDYNYTLLFAWGETQHMTSSFEKLVTVKQTPFVAMLSPIFTFSSTFFAFIFIFLL